MNKPSRRSRSAVKLSPLTDQRLTSYALAARAAGVGILALAAPVEGKIVYTPTHHVITHGASYNLDLNRDGVTDFILKDTFFTNCSTFASSVAVNPAVKGNGAEGWTGFRPYAFALKPGAKIGPAQYFPGREMASLDSGPGGKYYVGSWVNVKKRYLGLRFKIDGKTHYGWARLSVEVGSHNVSATLTGYAYETVVNEPIIAGDTKGPDDVTLEPASLGHLAAGAAAIPAWRSGK